VALRHGRVTQYPGRQLDPEEFQRSIAGARQALIDGLGWQARGESLDLGKTQAGVES
jgi:hypothetical protein